MNDEHRWVRVTEVANLPLREGRAVRLGSRDVALFNLGDRILATDNACPHHAGPLCDGIVTGDSVVCPLHAWKVNLANGVVERPAAGRTHCVTTYPTRVENGVVVIGLPVVVGGNDASTVRPARNGGEVAMEPSAVRGALNGAVA